MIRKALLLRLTAYQRAKNASATIEKGLELDSQGQALFMQELQNLTEFFESIMLAEKGRFELAKVYDQAKSLFEAELPSVWESLPVQKRGDFKPRFKAGQ